MNTLALTRIHWLVPLLAWLRRPAATARVQAKPRVRIAGLR